MSSLLVSAGLTIAGVAMNMGMNYFMARRIETKTMSLINEYKVKETVADVSNAARSATDLIKDTRVEVKEVKTAISAEYSQLKYYLRQAATGVAVTVICGVILNRIRNILDDEKAESRSKVRRLEEVCAVLLAFIVIVVGNGEIIDAVSYLHKCVSGFNTIFQGLIRISKGLFKKKKEQKEEKEEPSFTDEVAEVVKEVQEDLETSKESLLDESITEMELPPVLRSRHALAIGIKDGKSIKKLLGKGYVSDGTYFLRKIDQPELWIGCTNCEGLFRDETHCPYCRQRQLVPGPITLPHHFGAAYCDKCKKHTLNPIKVVGSIINVKVPTPACPCKSTTFVADYIIKGRSNNILPFSYGLAKLYAPGKVENLIDFINPFPVRMSGSELLWGEITDPIDSSASNVDVLLSSGSSSSSTSSSSSSSSSSASSSSSVSIDEIESQSVVSWALSGDGKMVPDYLLDNYLQMKGVQQYIQFVNEGGRCACGMAIRNELVAMSEHIYSCNADFVKLSMQAFAREDWDYRIACLNADTARWRVNGMPIPYHFTSVLCPNKQLFKALWGEDLVVRSFVPNAFRGVCDTLGVKREYHALEDMTFTSPAEYAVNAVAMAASAYIAYKLTKRFIARFKKEEKTTIQEVAEGNYAAYFDSHGNRVTSSNVKITDQSAKAKHEQRKKDAITYNEQGNKNSNYYGQASYKVCNWCKKSVEEKTLKTHNCVFAEANIPCPFAHYFKKEKKKKDFKCIDNCKFDHKSEFGSTGEFNAFIKKFAIRCVISDCDKKCPFVHIAPTSMKAAPDHKKGPAKVWVIKDKVKQEAKKKKKEVKDAKITPESKITTSMITEATTPEHAAVYPLYLTETSTSQVANGVAVSGKFYFPNHNNHRDFCLYAQVGEERVPLLVSAGDPTQFSLTKKGTVVNCPIPSKFGHIKQLKLANAPGKTDECVRLIWKWDNKDFMSTGIIQDGDALTTLCSAYAGVCCAPYINESGKVVGFHMWGHKRGLCNGAGFPGKHYSDDEDFVLVESNLEKGAHITDEQRFMRKLLDGDYDEEFDDVEPQHSIF